MRWFFVQVTVNGKIKEIKENMSVAELLKNEGYSGWISVWINGKQLFEKEYNHHIIKDNDAIKIIRPLGGG